VAADSKRHQGKRLNLSLFTLNPLKSLLSRPGVAVAAIAGYAVLLAVAIAMNYLFFAALPLVLAALALALVRRDLLMWAITAMVPLSMSLEDLGIGGLGLYLPTEPLLFGLLLLFLLDRIGRIPMQNQVMSHPIARIIAAMFIWLLLTTVTSFDPLVSLKFTIARAWFVVGFFFILIPLFSSRKGQQRFVALYLSTLTLVIGYTLVRHAGYGFDKDAGHWVMSPFFKDHTSYGAVLAMMFFPAVALAMQRKDALVRLATATAVLVLSVGLIFSFTRAAWLSIAAAGGLGVLIYFGVRLRTLALVGCVLGIFIWGAKDQLLISMERNTQDSSDNLTEHVESMSNVSSDASNLERINRWNCALALFYERPLTGWGPGTYQFVYAPFQRSVDRTIISTNNADKGNAHSEYLGPLAEQGVLGMLIMLALLWWASDMGFRLVQHFKATGNREQMLWALAVYLGLMTYFIHGVLNNYLDTDKASALFWGFLAILVAMDLQRKRQVNSAVSSAGG
jgi:putative inorganic carbon (hco3(-)) transporter